MLVYVSELVQLPNYGQEFLQVLLQSKSKKNLTVEFLKSTIIFLQFKILYSECSPISLLLSLFSDCFIVQQLDGIALFD